MMRAIRFRPVFSHVFRHRLTSNHCVLFSTATRKPTTATATGKPGSAQQADWHRHNPTPSEDAVVGDHINESIPEMQQHTIDAIKKEHLSTKKPASKK
ncbi:hypothetical protein BDV3_003107 [Batrachochytrium dendrobatidis]|nr:hypothetical protein O5D80_001404 [Batrachochytrium dendrobatidis]OAJ44796.1 hypothetical protein BDEG_27989 [Batrachochytrium dendrobatidis JEL423]